MPKQPKDSKPVREFKGTRDQCQDWLLNNGFQFDRGRLVHAKLDATIMYENHGDFLGEVRDWDKATFIARIYRR
jgi:hypothetical protein